MQLLALILSLGGTATLLLPEINASIDTGPGDVVLLDAKGLQHNVKGASEGRMSLVLSTHLRWWLPGNAAEVVRIAREGPSLNPTQRADVAASAPV